MEEEGRAELEQMGLNGLSKKVKEKTSELDKQSTERGEDEEEPIKQRKIGFPVNSKD